MGEQVKYTDLFEGDIVAKIQELIGSLSDLQGEHDKIRKDIQSKAIELRISISKDGLSFDEISRLATETEKLSKAIKILDDAQLEAAKASVVAEQALQEQLKTEQQREKLAREQLRTEQAKNKQQRDNNKLTDEEKARVDALRASIDALMKDKSKLAQVDRDAIKYVEIEKQSYNELAQTYNVLKEALNKATSEERVQVSVLAQMEKQARAVKDQMNNLQKATGNYTLNVGNYQSAFDGLGWSVRNVVRELPALGINLNTFFLAISNNIPIVIDEIKRFNDEQKKVAEAIANGTAEAGTQVQSVGKKIISTILSWQTALIVGITILTKYGKQIGEWVVGLFKAEKAISGLKTAQEALGEINNAILEETKDEELELQLIIDRLKDVKQGTDEWRNSIARVNEITGENLDYTTATVDSVKAVTKAYIDQAIQLAKNRAIIEQITESEQNKIKRDKILGGTTVTEILTAMGESYFDENGEVSEKAQKVQEYLLAKLEPKAQSKRVYSPIIDLYNKISDKITNKNNENEVTKFENWVRSQYRVMSDADIERLRAEYDAMLQEEKRPTDPKSKEATIKDYEDFWREVAEARVNAMKESYQKEFEQEELNNKITLEEYKKQFEEKKAILLENKENEFITTDEYNKELLNLEQQYEDLTQKQAVIHSEKMQAITNAELKSQEEALITMAQKRIELLEKQYKVEEEHSRKRSRNQTEETAKNLQLIKQIEAQMDMINELNKLKEQATTLGEVQEYIEAINKAENGLVALKSKLTIDRRQSKQDPLTEWIGKTLTKDLLSMDDTQLREVYIQKIAEAFGISEEKAKKIADLIGIEKIWADMEEQGIESAEALKDAVGDILDTIADVASAYADLADAKVQSAQAGVDAAQEAYDKEKALLEAGYANSVETAWAELEEQKKIQKQAEEEQKKAQRVQIAIDTATQATNLITGVSEIWKKFASNPILAGILTATMISGFTASKIMAYKATQYGDGHVELLDYGGSHASGNDMPLATDRNGRQRRVERGEAFAVFNKRAVQRQGYSKIRDIVDSINKGTYERQAMNTLQRDTEIGMMFTHQTADLSKIEGSLAKVVENTGKRTYVDKNGDVVEINGNTKRIIKG